MAFVRFILLILTSFSLMGISLVHADDCQTQKQEFSSWFHSKLRPSLAKEGFSASFLSENLKEIEYSCKIKSLKENQPEFSSPPWLYIDGVAKNLEQALEKKNIYQNELAQIEEELGVDREFLISIWGRESQFGEKMGTFSVLQAVVNRAYSSWQNSKKLKNLWWKNVVSALKILKKTGRPANEFLGSWSGAFGHTQFIPTTYDLYAVDFDGDGIKNLWGENPVDALASAANHLKRKNFKKGQGWGKLIELPENFNYQIYFKELEKNYYKYTKRSERKKRPWLTREAFSRAGLDIASLDIDSETNSKTLQLYQPMGVLGPSFLLYENFQSIYDYNTSHLYSLAVSLFAEAIKEEQDVVSFVWPKNQRVLTKSEKYLMQKLLNHLGFSAGKADGIFGSKTKMALHKLQLSRGIENADAYPTEELLLKLAEENKGFVNEVLLLNNRNTKKLIVNYGGQEINFKNRPLNYLERTSLQEKLNEQGYSVGKVDGILGKKSVEQFQKYLIDKGLIGSETPVTVITRQLYELQN